MALARLVVIVASMWTPQIGGDSVAACREWHECQRLALEARSRGDYEHFHDLAWRTVQTGPARNAELMYMLARAQSLSGRPHDALVMLGRVAEMGVTIGEAATDDDFAAVRQLRQWPELEAVIAAAGRPAKISTPPEVSRPAEVSKPTEVPRPTEIPRPAKAPRTAEVSRPAKVSPPAEKSPATAAVPRAVEDGLPFPGRVLGSAGLAYDRVSSRFVAADAALQKLLIIDQRSGHLVDLVTSASAGFYAITGLEIDPARGNLWVVSAEPASAEPDPSPASALHKLQLVSGRPLDRIPIPDDLQPCRLADVAVTRDGGVLVLDTTGNRLLRLGPATHTFTPVVTLDVQGSTSLAPASDRLVYVAHSTGIARIDTVTGAVRMLAGSHDVPLDGFDRIRWARDSLIGVQRLSDASRRVVRIKIAGGRAVAMDVIDSGLDATANSVMTVSGDEFYFVAHPSGGDADDVVIRRSRIR